MDIFENQNRVRLFFPKEDFGENFVANFEYLIVSWDRTFVDSAGFSDDNTWWDIHPMEPGNPQKGYKLSNQGLFISTETIAIANRNAAVQKLTPDAGQAAVFVVANTNPTTSRYTLLSIGTNNALGLDTRGTLGTVEPLQGGNSYPYFQYFCWQGSLDPGIKPVTYIDTVQQAVKGYFNHLSGPAYIRLLDTPHVWGMPFGKQIMPQALAAQADFERAIVEIVQKARYRLDLSSLNSPDPDWTRALLGAIDTSLTTQMGRTQPTQFRFLFGQTPATVGTPANYTDFEGALIRLIRERSASWEMMPEIWIGRFSRIGAGIISALQAKVFGSDILGSDDTKMTWNHSKIISVDGSEALVGGHNLNMDLFRSYPPVHDVSVVVHGAPAYGAQLYLNNLWACGTGLLTRSSLDTTRLAWVIRDRDGSAPSDPLAQAGAAAYMTSRQQALIALHQSGTQSGTDPVQPSGEQPVPPNTRDQDLQTLNDLQLDVFQERIIYNTYAKFSDYKLATRVLTLGKYWNGPDPQSNFLKASEVMKETLIKSAKRIIRMSQMDIVSAWKKNWSDHVVCQWVLQALLANPSLEVQIVVSPLDAAAGAGGDQYSFGSGATRTFDLLTYYMLHDAATDQLLDDSNGLRAAALKRLHVSPFYFTDQVPPALTTEGVTYKWPDLSRDAFTATLKQPPLSESPPRQGVIGSAAMAVINASGYRYSKVASAPGNHAKIMIIDDEVYVVGSDNLYPGFLSEVDYLIEGDAVRELVSSYWSPLWQYSSRRISQDSTVSISGTVKTTDAETYHGDVCYELDTNYKPLILSGNAPNGGSISFYVLVPVWNPNAACSAPGDKNTCVWTKLNGSDLGNLRVSNYQVSTSSWQLVGPIALGQGNFTVEISCGEGDGCGWPANTAPNYVSGIDFVITPPILPDGTRVRDAGNGFIYLVLNGTLRHIPGPQTYTNLFKDWSSVMTLSNVQSYSIGAPINEAASLVKTDSNDNVYFLLDGEKLLITSPAVFDNYGFSWSVIKIITAVEMSAIPNSSALV